MCSSNEGIAERSSESEAGLVLGGDETYWNCVESSHDPAEAQAPLALLEQLMRK